MKLICRVIKKIDIELTFLTVSLLVLALSDPAKEHFSFCVFKMAGFEYCPGCGIGHSISWLFRGNIRESFQCHFMGIPAVLIMLHRIYQLSLEHLNKRKPITFKNNIDGK